MQGGSHEDLGDGDVDLDIDGDVDLDIDVEVGLDRYGEVLDMVKGLLGVGDVYNWGV